MITFLDSQVNRVTDSKHPTTTTTTAAARGKKHHLITTTANDAMCEREKRDDQLISSAQLLWL
jgi:hypothetical protein